MLCSNQSLYSPPCASQSVGAANQLFVALVETLSAALCAISPPQMWPKDYAPIAIRSGLDDYDFIVIGAGSAGATVAARLSEIPEFTVLLLEAGGDPPIESEIPAFFFTLQKTRADWQYHPQSSTACKAMVGGCYWPRGKCLGGSSTINAMYYVRGNKFDFGEWVRAGNTNWDYESNLPYFKKSEANLEPSFVEFENGRYHSADGPMKVDFYGELNDIHKALIGAATERGHEFIEDINADKLFGYLNIQGTLTGGRRKSTAKSFLIPAKDRPNLHIIKNAFVEKILINDDKRAYGVKFTIDGKYPMKAYNKREVILSAGSLNSPPLLMLSGVGPRDQLKKFNIPIKSVLPVGKNLKDHIYAQLYFKFNALPCSPLDQLDYFYQYLTRKTGPYANPTQIGGFLSTVNGTDRPDIQLVFLVVPPNSPDLKVYLDLMNYSPEINQTLFEANVQFSIGLIAVILLHPESTGSITLNGTNPYSKPNFFPNYFSEKSDVDTLVRAIKEQVSFVDTDAYKSLEIDFLKIPLDECDRYQYGTDKYWNCYCRYMSTTIYHPIGTSRMGPKNDGTTVVDSFLKVHGIDDLRQIDAGCFPSLVSGNTNAATIMMGERGADFIKADYLISDKDDDEMCADMESQDQSLNC